MLVTGERKPRKDGFWLTGMIRSKRKSSNRRPLAKAGDTNEPRLVLNYLATQIAMVTAGRRIAIVTSFSFPECRNQKLIMCRLINPVVPFDLLRPSVRRVWAPNVQDHLTKSCGAPASVGCFDLRSAEEDLQPEEWLQ